MNAEIAQRVQKILARHLGVKEDKIKLEAKLGDDLGADSLDTVELIMAFENEFDLVIPDEDAEKVLTVKDIIAYIEKKTKTEEEIAAGQSEPV